MIAKRQAAELDDKFKILEKADLFRDVPLSSVRYFLDRCVEHTFNAGELILRPDVHNDHMFLILAGVMTVHLENIGNDSIAEASAGECVGEMSVFDGKHPCAYVLAKTDCVTLVIDREILWAMINFSHGVSRNLLYLLSRRIRSGNVTMSEVRKQRDQQQEEANKDGLTGLHNRRWLETLVLRMRGRALEDFAPVAVIMLDVDHFKSFNDRFGHQAGDEVLRTVSGCLRTGLRPHDRVARYGGEEFVVLLPNTTRKAALRVAERLREKVEQSETREGESLLPTVTISLGVAQWRVGVSIEELVGEADAALYQAKQLGRNRVCEAL